MVKGKGIARKRHGCYRIIAKNEQNGPRLNGTTLPGMMCQAGSRIGYSANQELTKCVNSFIKSGSVSSLSHLAITSLTCFVAVFAAVICDSRISSIKSSI